MQDDILLPLDLAEVKDRVKQRVDPAERYCGASIETAMHGVLPHRVVLHVHCVNTIAWAVRQDALVQVCQMTMKCMLLARTRLLEQFFLGAFSIPVNRSFELEHAVAVPLGSLSQSQRPMGESISFSALLDH